MNKIVAIRYIDAFYFLKEEGLKYAEFKIQIAVGWVGVRNNCLVLAFTKKNNIPQRGLLMRRRALILGNENNASKFGAKLKLLKLLETDIGSDVGIFWEDIVYFENGDIPDRPTVMYTEGRLFKITANAVVVKRPKTIKIKGGATNHHPKHPGGRLMYFVIPKLFITDVELYGEKN